MYYVAILIECILLANIPGMDNFTYTPISEYCNDILDTYANRRTYSYMLAMVKKLRKRESLGELDVDDMLFN